MDEQAMVLVERKNGTGSFVNAIVSLADGVNHLAPLPENYTYDDLVITGNDGDRIGTGQLVTLTGVLIKDTRACRLRVEKLESEN